MAAVILLMSSSSLSIIESKLAAFAQRRRRIILVRGISLLIGTWLMSMMIVAVIDRHLVLPDLLRYILSFTAYLAAIIAFWRSAGRRLYRPADEVELARLIESQHPDFNDNLIATVALQESSDSTTQDKSKDFKQLVSESAADHLKTVRIDALLPIELARSHLVAAVSIALLCALLIAIPSTRFLQLMCRAAMPAANLARVSDATITIESPARIRTVVPANESLAVSIRVNATDTDSITPTIEVIDDTGKRSNLPMAWTADDRYAADINIGTDAFEFRIKAADAITRWHRLETRHRPRVVTFDKTYTYPAYTAREPKTVQAKSGDIKAIQGSSVQLAITADQPLRDAKIGLAIGTASTAIQSLQPTSDPHTFTATIPLEATGTFTLTLTSAETDFTNRGPTKYPITVKLDAAPNVSLSGLPESSVHPADAVINMVADIQDDLGIKRVVQSVTTKSGATLLNRELVTEAGSDIQVEFGLDMLALGLESGEQVVTKLIAEDHKGQTTESSEFQIKVAPSNWNPDRFNRLAHWTAVGDALRSLRQSAADTARVANSQAAKDADGPSLTIGNTLTQTAVQRSLDALGSTMQVIPGAVTTARGEREADILVTLARILSDLRLQLTDTRDADTSAAANALTDIATFVERLHREFDYTTQFAQAAALIESLHELHEEQQRITHRFLNELPEESSAMVRLVERQRVTLSLAEQAVELGNDLVKRLPGHLALRAEQTVTALSSMRLALARLFADQKPKDDPTARLQRWQTILHESRKDLSPILRDTSERGTKARHAIIDQLDDAVNVDRLESWADAEEHRSEPDYEFISRLRSLTDAHLTGSDPIDQDRYLAIVLDHRLSRTIGAVEQLQGDEHWEPRASHAGTQRPQDWRWVTDQPAILQAYCDGLMQREASTAFEMLITTESFLAIGEEMSARHRMDHRLTPSHQHLESVATELKSIRDALQSRIQDAVPDASQPKSTESKDPVVNALNDLLDKSSAQMLRGLEEQLRANRAMQQELSAISRRTWQSAHDVFREALRDQMRIQMTLSRLDAEQSTALKDSQRMMQSLRETSNRMSTKDLPAIRDDAHAGGLDVRRLTPALLKVSKQMAEVSDWATTAIDQNEPVPNESLNELIRILDKAVKELNAADEIINDRVSPALEASADASERNVDAQTTAGDIASTLDQHRMKIAKRELEVIQAEQLEKAATAVLDRSVDRYAEADQIVMQAERTLAQAGDRNAFIQAKKVLALAKDKATTAKTAMDDAAKRTADANKQLRNRQKALGDARNELAQARNELSTAHQSIGQAQTQQARLGGLAQWIQIARVRSLQAINDVKRMREIAGELGGQRRPAYQPDKASLNAAADKQDGIADELGQLADKMDRAARHAVRMRREDVAEQMKQVSESTRSAVTEDLSTAASSLRDDTNLGQARDAVDKAKHAIETLTVSAAGQARSTRSPATVATTNDRPLPSKNASKWMSRAIDRLDHSLTADSESREASLSEAMNAIRSAIRAQNATRRSRQDAVPYQSPSNDPQQPSDESNADQVASTKLDDSPIDPSTPRNTAWGYLPPRIAESLIKAKRETVTGKYKEVVDAYYRAIAERGSRRESEASN